MCMLTKPSLYCREKNQKYFFLLLELFLIQLDIFKGYFFQLYLELLIKNMSRSENAFYHSVYPTTPPSPTTSPTPSSPVPPCPLPPKPHEFSSWEEADPFKEPRILIVVGTKLLFMYCISFFQRSFLCSEIMYCNFKVILFKLVYKNYW